MLIGPEHIRRYEATDGEEGYYQGDLGATILILTTVGRKSGAERKNALIYQEVDGGYAVMASDGGAQAHPGWYFNLVADPEVKVQIKGDRFVARARVADSQERARIWPVLTKVWPNYEEYARKTDREMPIVVLERI